MGRGELGVGLDQAGLGEGSDRWVTRKFERCKLLFYTVTLPRASKLFPFFTVFVLKNDWCGGPPRVCARDCWRFRERARRERFRRAQPERKSPGARSRPESAEGREPRAASRETLSRETREERGVRDNPPYCTEEPYFTRPTVRRCPVYGFVTQYTVRVLSHLDLRVTR